MIMAVLLPLALQAQDSKWERPADADTQYQNMTSSEKAKAKKAEEKAKKAEAEKKYLKGAAPIIDGYVQWTLNLDIPGKTADEIYDTIYKYMQRLTSGENQITGSQIALVNKAEHGIVTNVREWIVFRNAFLSLDRTKASYALLANNSDGKLEVKIMRIVFDYTENTPGANGIYTAEEWISDENSLSKKGKMYPKCAKFRRKMIDRKDQIFEEITKLFSL